ncbi:hypothetical protein [Acetobacterium malicum]|uniref:hypothetical protein n=1 Tax=Acetobacterium malicum TaxID=52692 RepID=UPI001FA729E2|nr:hypothetical protein [Acetobacterium dehalogenans]
MDGIFQELPAVVNSHCSALFTMQIRFLIEYHVLRGEDDYTKNRNYWKYLKTKLKKEKNELVSAANQLKLTAADGKKYRTDTFDYDGIIELAKNFPSKQANRFIEWFSYSDETIDGKSQSKAYALFDSSLFNTIEVGTLKGLQQIHGYLC